MKLKTILFLLVCSTTLNSFSQSSNEAMLNEQCLFMGAKSYVKVGSYSGAQMGIRYKSLASFHLPEGMAVQLFEGANFNGISETFYSSVICLVKWKGHVASIKLYMVNDAGSELVHAGTNSPPQGDKVIFYKDMKYSGMSKMISTGSFDGSTLGFLTEQISSIYIPAGQSVSVTDRSGRTQIFDNSMFSLAQYNWDNKISGGTINSNFGGTPGFGGTLTPRGDKVIFYRDMKFSGAAKLIGQGSFGASALGSLFTNVSSIYIPIGQYVTFYDRYGNAQTFYTSMANLAPYGWDNKVTSGFSGINNGGSTGGSQGGNGGGGSQGGNGGSGSQGGNGRGGSQGGNGGGGSQGGNGGGFGQNTSGVGFYKNTNYAGSETIFQLGKFDNLGLGVENNISSIKIPAGFAVVVFENRNCVGKSTTFTKSVANLSVLGWSKRISSAYVFKL